MPHTIKLEDKGEIIESRYCFELGRRYKAFKAWNKKYGKHLNGMYLIIIPTPFPHSPKHDKQSLSAFIKQEKHIIQQKRIRDRNEGSKPLCNTK